MTMEEKNQLITQYIYNSFLELKQLCPKDKGFFVNEDKYKKFLDLFLNRDEDIEILKKEMDLEKEKLLDSYHQWLQEEKERFLNQFEDEKQEKKGITLNRQMIELMMISIASSIDELQKICSKLAINLCGFHSLNLDQLKNEVFKSYTVDLADRNELYNNPNANLNQKLFNIINNAHLTSEQAKQLNSIIQDAMQHDLSSDEIYKNINSQFSQDISHNIFVSLSESRDLFEPGIQMFGLTDFKMLYSKLADFKSITIDYEAKYPAVHLDNGEFYFNKLERCLDFARSFNKNVRLNALIFFEDCPKSLSELEYTEENKQKVYHELLKYVDETTKMIASYNQKSLRENGYETVKSIDIFNELVTRFSTDFNGQYLNREDVPKSNSKESGWQKFLNIEDLCSVAMVARKNLPDVEFVCNEINLEDQNKLPVFKSIIDRIRFFEEKNKEALNGRKLFDCIGTQWHLSPYTTENELDYSLSALSSYGYPIKITEYDQPLSDEYISTHSSQECEKEKVRNQEKLKNYIEKNANKYNIKQVTVWSITDSTSFLLDERNKLLIREGQQPIQSIYAGGFRTEKSFSRRSQSEIQIYQQIKQNNEMIKQKKSKKQYLDKPNVKTLTQNSSGNSLGSSGFSNIITLSLIIVFLCGIFFMVIYMFIKER